MASQIIETDGLVLRKTAYSESSLVIAVLSPEQGQVHFLAKGALKTGKKRFPDIDLFRMLRISYRLARRGNLHAVVEVECQRSYDDIAASPEHFHTAQWLARLVLRNCQENVEAQAIYQALITAFERMRQPPNCGGLPVALAFCFVFLAEHGLLEDYTEQQHIHAQIQQMLSCGSDPRQPIPDYQAADWRALGGWMRDMMDSRDLDVPDGYWDKVIP